MAKKTTPMDQSLPPAQEASLFHPGHNRSQKKRRTLREQLDQNRIPTLGKRIRLARHFGISDHSWRSIKSAAKDAPELVTAWDSGFRPSTPENVKLARDGREKHAISRYDEFCRTVYQNINISVAEISRKMHLDENLATVWLAEVKGSKRYKELSMRADAEFEGSLTELMQKSISVMKKSDMPAKEYIGLLSQIMTLYKTLQDGKMKREALIAQKEAKATEEIIHSALAVKLDLTAVNQPKYDEPDAPDFSGEGDI